MYRTQNEEKNKQFLNHTFNDNKSSLYYKVSMYLLDLYEYLRKSTGETIEIGVGNCLSDVMIIIDKNKNSKDILDFFRNILTSKNMKKKFHNVFITPFEKSSNKDKNKYVIQQEIKVIKPKLIISFVDINDINVDNAQIEYIDRETFNRMYYLMNNGTEDTIQELKELKINIWNKIKNIKNLM